MAMVTSRTFMTRGSDGARLAQDEAFDADN
jgi:hypothetical protein